jgi:glycosyltransferase involved in cell wall biosynthesis
VLRVTLDVTAVPARPAGAGRYTIELAGALRRRADVELVTVARRGDGDRWSGAADRRPETAVALAPDRRPARLAWEQLRLPRVLEHLGPAVHHSPHYTMPERARLPVVVTVHDCTFLDHPEWHERSKALLFARAIRVAGRRASSLVCVSQTTADRLAELCPTDVPVVVAPHGVDHARFTPEEPGRGADDEALAGLAVADRPLVVFLGTLEPRKGVAGLVRAFDSVAGGHPDALLVIAGQRGWGTDEVARALAVARHRDRVLVTGYLAEPAVPALLRRAAVVAYPALEEGYGLPAIEALACGAPLVTTRGTAMAEAAEGSAVLVEPGNDVELAEAIDGLLAGDRATPARRADGLAAAARRTWDASALRHLEAYRLALDAHVGR